MTVSVVFFWVVLVDPVEALCLSMTFFFGTDGWMNGLPDTFGAVVKPTDRGAVVDFTYTAIEAALEVKKYITWYWVVERGEEESCVTSSRESRVVVEGLTNGMLYGFRFGIKTKNGEIHRRDGRVVHVTPGAGAVLVPRQPDGHERNTDNTGDAGDAGGAGDAGDAGDAPGDAKELWGTGASGSDETKDPPSKCVALCCVVKRSLGAQRQR